MSEFLVVGEALVDIVVSSDGRRVEHVGGSPANVALGLARLGVPTDLLTWIALDERGRRVNAHLEASGVRVMRESFGAVRTPTALARLDAEGAATYEFDLSWALGTRSVIHTTKAVHVGSIAAVADLQPRNAVLELVHQARHAATISYDPNLRPSIMGSPEAVRSDVEALVAASDVVKVSDEDLQWLDPDVDPLTTAAAWARQSDCAFVVVTRGGEGSTAVLRDGSHVSVPAPAVTVADTVGAGDSYMSGLLTALHDRHLTGAESRADLAQISKSTLVEILEFAARTAAITVSRAGANPPHLDELIEAR